MIWKNLFSHDILNRGRSYYKNNKVKNLKNTDENHYTANVRGTKNYNISVEITDDRVSEIECDCPYSQSGYYCKHMAAVLFAIDDDMKKKQQELQQKELAAPKKRIYPFKKNPEKSDSEKYQYFDLGKITKDILIYDDTYKKATEILQNNQITNFKTQLGYNAYNASINNEMLCQVNATFEGDKKSSELIIIFDKNQILNVQCMYSCGKGYYRGVKKTNGERELCPHLIALLIVVGQYLDENNVGDSTDLTAMELLTAFRSTRAISNDAENSSGRQVSLEPRITKSSKCLYLSFRIGCDKMYVVRNLTDLVDRIENKQTINFGKLTLNFAQDLIREQDSALYTLIKNIVLDEVHRVEQSQRSYFYFSKDETIKADIELYGTRLDDFFDIVNGTEITYTDKDQHHSVSSSIGFEQGSPDISLEITNNIDENGIFHGIIAEGNVPDFIKGAKYSYFFDDKVLYRIDQSSEVLLKPLYGLMKNGKISFYIGRQRLSEFYYTVLPRLRSVISIDEHNADEIEQYLPPEVKFIFYLDMVDGVPLCRATAQYGEISCSAMDCLFEEVKKESFRDTYRETEAVNVVRKYFPEIDRANNQFRCSDDADEIYSIMENGINELLRLGEVQCTNSFKAVRFRKNVQFKVGVSVSGDFMNLEISSTDVSPKELLEILQSYKQKKRYHRLKNGEFLNIDDSISELSSMVDTMHLSPSELIKGKIKIPTYRALYLDKMSEQCDALYIQRDRHFKKIIQGFKTVNDSDFEVPESLQGIMRNYQVYGHKWLRTLEAYGFGGILADDMGLGKTLQMISVFSAAKAEGKTGTSIVICPSSLVYNWLEELSRFAPELSTVAIAGTQKERTKIIESLDKYDVAVTSYDLLKRDIAAYENIHFLYQVLDEAQYIKTHTTAAAKSVKIIQSKSRFALTGTPIENRLSELWSIFDYLMPGFLYGYETFKKEMETPIVKKNDEETVKRLKRMTSPFILRRLKSDVLKDLPEKIEEIRYAKFSEQQQLVYDGQVLHMKNLLDSQNDEDVKKNKLQILAELTKIRQICCDPSLLFEDYKGESAKRTACMDLIKSAIEGEHKILLFSQFTSMLELLEHDLNDSDISYYKITGSTPKKERMKLVQKFNSDKTSVFLISLKAGGTGLNLTGADVVIHYDPWWNIAAQNQATDRAHRIGQSKVVSVYKLIAKNSIEEKILKMQELKKNLADEILTGELGNLGSLSKEELLQLII